MFNKYQGGIVGDVVRVYCSKDGLVRTSIYYMGGFVERKTEKLEVTFQVVHALKKKTKTRPLHKSLLLHFASK